MVNLPEGVARRGGWRHIVGGEVLCYRLGCMRRS